MQISDHQLPEIALQWIGFSPDNRTLGMSGFSEADGQYRFILIDTENGTSRLLPIVAIFNRIAWSPDGNRILVLEEIPPSFDSDVERLIYVYSSEDGQLLDQIKVEDEHTELNDLRIFYGGVVEFNPGIQDISSCTAPPGD
jgi:dipeptidyl aminopeptidase/acylaminoacyl peptidase